MTEERRQTTDGRLRTADYGLQTWSGTAGDSQGSGTSPDSLFRRKPWGLDGIRERLDYLLQSQVGASIEFEDQSTRALRKTLLIKAHSLSTDGSRVLLLLMEDITLRREAELLVSKQKAALEGAGRTARSDGASIYSAERRAAECCAGVARRHQPAFKRAGASDS